MEENKKNDEIIRPKQNYIYDIDYDALYSNNIIDEIKTSYDFEIKIEGHSTYGRIYIDNDKYLHILDKEDNSTKQIDENKKFTTIYNIDTKNPAVIVVFAISEDGKLYLLSLSSNNIIDVNIVEMEIPAAVKKITNLHLKQYDDLLYTSVVVYTEDGKMYDSNSGIQYSENVLNIMNEYILYEDGGLSDMYGKMIIDKSGKIIKVKEFGAPVLGEEFALIGNPVVVFVTTDNRLTYLYENDKIYEHPKKVNTIKKDGELINVIFEDNTSLILSTTFNN